MVLVGVLGMVTIWILGGRELLGWGGRTSRAPSNCNNGTAAALQCSAFQAAAQNRARNALPLLLEMHNHDIGARKLKIQGLGKLIMPLLKKS